MIMFSESQELKGELINIQNTTITAVNALIEDYNSSYPQSPKFTITLPKQELISFSRGVLSKKLHTNTKQVVQVVQFILNCDYMRKGGSTTYENVQEFQARLIWWSGEEQNVYGS